MNIEVWEILASPFLVNKLPKAEEAQEPHLCAGEEPGEGGRRKK